MRWLPMMIHIIMFLDQHAAYTRCLYILKSCTMMKQRHVCAKLGSCQCNECLVFLRAASGISNRQIIELAVCA
ncbi:hypothetical protein J3F84DRAFT_356247 [Trichoderma pleuroticola]